MAHNNQVQMKPAIKWSKLVQSPINLEKLKLLTHTPEHLIKNGYIIRPLTEQEMWTKMRCQNCGAKLKKYRPPTTPTHPNNSNQFNPNNLIVHAYNEIDAMEEDAEYGTRMSEQRQYEEEIAIARAAGYFEQPSKHVCFFHDGQLFKGEYKCCGGRQNTKGCCSELQHLPSTVEQLRLECWIHRTPKHKSQSPQDNSVVAFSSGRGGSSNRTRGSQNRGRGRGRGRGEAQTFGAVGRLRNHHEPPRKVPVTSAPPKRLAVSLDCEMGTTTLFASTLIRLTAVDFFTGEVLIDSLVAPAPPHCILHYNTRYSGVTFAAMGAAIRSGNVIRGADAARDLLFEYIDSQTIIIVHGGDNDFKSLRWLHPTDKIIDTCILESYDREVKEKGWKKNLKDVTRRRCNGIEIQNAKLVNGRDAGHDSLEDALACREIVAAWLRMIPDV